MRVGILFSSGKDSTFTLHRCRAEPERWEVVCLLTLLPANPDSHMFQRPARELVEAQAESLGLPVLFKETPGEKERELEELRLLLEEAKERYGIEGIASGALASDYQYTRINRLCGELGLHSYAPLWQQEQLIHMRQMVEAGFDIRMTRVAAMGLDESWLGRPLTAEDLDRLERLREEVGLHPAGEGGEFETIVLDGPGFAHPIRIAFTKEMESDERGELRITKIGE